MSEDLRNEVYRRARWDQDLLAKFWCQVHQREPDECWPWLGVKTRGYGRFSANGTTVPAHRFALAVAGRPVPSQLVTDHLCRNHSCVNPSHLEAVTQRENIMRGVAIPNRLVRQAATTECAHGHPWTPETTRLSKKGGYRHCRVCARDREREKYQLRRARALATTARLDAVQGDEA